MRKEIPIVSLLLVLPVPGFCMGADWKNFRADANRMEKRIQELSAFGANREGGVNRVAFSDADVEGRKYIRSLMEKAGLKVSVDAAGNIIGHREGHDPKLPVILFGSHIDSVPHGGNYDGNLGVLGGLECIEILNQQNFLTAHPLEVIVFSDEEGGLTGSHAVVGELSQEALQIKSHSGKTIGEGIRFIGGDPDNLQSAKRNPSEILAYLELHIEQGGILEAEKINIGVVEGIVGINLWNVTVLGFANHAGTTPMDHRTDALLAGAKLVDSVNDIASRRRHTRLQGDWSSDVCSSDLVRRQPLPVDHRDRLEPFAVPRPGDHDGVPAAAVGRAPQPVRQVDHSVMQAGRRRARPVADRKSVV